MKWEGDQSFHKVEGGRLEFGCWDFFLSKEGYGSQVPAMIEAVQQNDVHVH